jgi:glyceraldehyde 3-phosphate dehydrogenase
MTRVAINGFGRIGRNAFKIAFEKDDLEIVAINDLTDNKTLAYLLKHDSNYGEYHKDVSFDDDNLIVGDYNSDDDKVRQTIIPILAEKDPSKLPWDKLNVDVVIESTGFFTHHDELKLHIKAGAKKVVLSAPEKDDNIKHHDTYLVGVNETSLEPAHDIVSNASCTTNCITPIAAVIEQKLGIQKAMMTTIHSYTASQSLQDGPARGDIRESRSAAINIVPTTTGATTAAARALPALEGVFTGLSIRVPTPVVSLSDFTFLTDKDTTIEQVNNMIKQAAESSHLKGILNWTEEELVSTDFIGDPHSCIADLNLTNVVGGNMVKIVAWYDNEWGYSNRLVEMVSLMGKAIKNQPQ